MMFCYMAESVISNNILKQRVLQQAYPQHTHEEYVTTCINGNSI